MWYDWPYIFRHRSQLQSLDNVIALTRGQPLSWNRLLSSILPVGHVFTGVCDLNEGTQKLIGQLHQPHYMSGAYLNYLLQPEGSDPNDLIVLLENLMEHSGQWGAKHVVADLETDSDWFPQFRQAGFSVLAKQRVFRINTSEYQKADIERKWQTWTRDDISAMRKLYFTLVPPLIQPVEPFTRRETLGLVHYDANGSLNAYADMAFGPVGVWVLPFIHPQMKENIHDLLIQMIHDLPNLNGRPLYIATRSYQPWVEHALGDLPADMGPEQALMVRYLALRQRVKTEFPYVAVENGNQEPTVPFAPIKYWDE